jgi:hypothetical protein
MAQNLDTFRRSLKKTIADNLGQCIKQLEASLDPVSSTYNDCLKLLADFNRWERGSIANLLSREDQNIEFSRLMDRTMMLIDSLQEGDLSEVRQLRQEIHERLLVVTRQSRQAYMERFFSKNYFKNVQYIHFGDPVPAVRFDLAVLEDLEPEPYSSMLMEQYLDQIPCYILYFGAHQVTFDRSKYAEKVYYANSIFSLYARLKEMLDFIKYYDPAP